MQAPPRGGVGGAECSCSCRSTIAPMPVFVIKARDDLAVATIEFYAGLCTAAGLDEQREQVGRALDEIRAWRAANPDECRLPDHDHVPAGQPGSGPEGRHKNEPEGGAVMDSSIAVCCDDRCPWKFRGSDRDHTVQTALLHSDVTGHGVVFVPAKAQDG